MLCLFVILVYFGLYVVICIFLFFFFKQKTAYEMRISDWSSDVCSSDLRMPPALFGAEWFEMLQQLNGDQGARSLISRATLVVARPEDLVDIDSPADLERSMKHFYW